MSIQTDKLNEIRNRQLAKGGMLRDKLAEFRKDISWLLADVEGHADEITSMEHNLDIDTYRLAAADELASAVHKLQLAWPGEHKGDTADMPGYLVHDVWNKLAAYAKAKLKIPPCCLEQGGG